MTIPYPPRREQRCDNCFFSFELGKGDECRDVIECRRSAPPASSERNGLSYHAYWPEVVDFDWCGEWSPKEAQ